MKIKRMSFITLIVSIIFIAVSAISVRAEVNDSDMGFDLRAALGGGRVLWSYVSHSNQSGDLGTGKGGTFNLAGMFHYSIAALEANLLYGNTGDLEWEDEDDTTGETHTYKSTGSGYYSVLDLKLGVRLFAELGDMGYTFFYAGGRWWNTERTQDSIEDEDGNRYTDLEGKREGKGNGWIIGYRDFSTFGPNDSFSIALQTGFFFGKAPVKQFKKDGENENLTNDESVSLGGEIAGGVALQNLGFSAVGGFRGEINVTTFKDSSAPSGEESVFGFGNITFFVEAQMQF